MGHPPAELNEKDAQFLALKHIDNAGHQRRLGADDRQLDSIVFDELDQRRNILGADRHVFRFDGGSRIARRDENPAHARTLGDLPRQRVPMTRTFINSPFHARFAQLIEYRKAV